MILQSLYDYYRRKMADPDPARRLPAFGLESKEIPFILELTSDGRLAGIKDTRTPQGKKKVATAYRVPQGVKKTSGIAANFLWDAAEYVLARERKTALIIEGSDDNGRRASQAFRERFAERGGRVTREAGPMGPRPAPGFTIPQ